MIIITWPTMMTLGWLVRNCTCVFVSLQPRIFVSPHLLHLSSISQVCAKHSLNVPKKEMFLLVLISSTEGLEWVVPQLPLCFMSLACPAVHLATVNAAGEGGGLGPGPGPRLGLGLGRCRCQVFKLRAVKQVVVTLITCPDVACLLLMRLHYLVGHLRIHLGIDRALCPRELGSNYSGNLKIIFPLRSIVQHGCRLRVRHPFRKFSP